MKLAIRLVGKESNEMIDVNMFNELPNNRLRWVMRTERVSRIELADEFEISVHKMDGVLWREQSSDWEDVVISVVKAMARGEKQEHPKGEAFLLWTNNQRPENVYAEILRGGEGNGQARKNV